MMLICSNIRCQFDSNESLFVESYNVSARMDFACHKDRMTTLQALLDIKFQARESVFFI
jgi:hypothetical protein